MKAPIRAMHPITGPVTGDGAMILPADPGAVQEARAFLRGALGPHLGETVTGVAVLLASELVTNAVVHAASEVEVLWNVDGACATVVVRDADTGPLVRGSSPP